VPRQRIICLGATGISDARSSDGRGRDKSKETQEASRVEATKPEWNEEIDIDVKSISTYTESSVEVVAVGSEIGTDIGDRDIWSEVDVEEGLETRAAGNGLLGVDANDKNEAWYEAVGGGWKVGGKVLVAMGRRTACCPKEITQDGGGDKMEIEDGTQGVGAKKSDSGSGSFQIPSV